MFSLCRILHLLSTLLLSRNQLRIVDELGIAGLNDRTLPYHGGVYWLRGTGVLGDPLTQIDREENAQYNQHRESIVPSESAAERLKWMLQKTMGSVDAFELRRRELGRERSAIMSSSTAFSSRYSEQPTRDTTGDDSTAYDVSDGEVAQSYIRSCDPISGIMFQYLARAKLAVRFGPALFIHGALPFTPHDNLTFPTPWIIQRSKPMTQSLTEWIDELNNFASCQISAWRAHGQYLQRKQLVSHDGIWATEGGYSNISPGGRQFGDLLQYGMNTLPDRSKNSTVVYGSWMKDGMPRGDLFGDENELDAWSSFLQREGIEVIATGHKPVGDMPWPIQIPSEDATEDKQRRCWIIPCDTSFSGDTVWVSNNSFDERSNLGRGSGRSGRGDVAFCETLVQNCPTSGTTVSVEMQGCLSDGTYYESGNLMEASEDNVMVGRLTAESFEYRDEQSKGAKRGVFWVKGRVDERMLISRGKGFSVWNAVVDPREL